MKTIRNVMAGLVALMAVVVPALAATWVPLDTGSAAAYGANYVLEFKASDLTTTTTNSAQVFTNITLATGGTQNLVLNSNQIVRFRFAQLVSPAVGPTNWTFGLKVQIGDSTWSNRYLDSMQLATASTNSWIGTTLTSVQTGTPSATNGLVLPTVVTNIAMPEKNYTANDNLVVRFSPNAENSVSQSSGVVWRAYFWLSPRGQYGGL